jgi:hypothetical protein
MECNNDVRKRGGIARHRRAAIVDQAGEVECLNRWSGPVARRAAAAVAIRPADRCSA